MDKSLFRKLFKSLNPDSYSELSESTLIDTIKYFLFILVFFSIIMFVLFIPTIFSLPHIVSSDATNFDVFAMNITIASSKNFVLSADPLVKVYSAETNLTNERVIISPDGVEYRRFFLFGSVVSIPLNRAVDFRNESSVSSSISLMLFFLLPSLIFWSLIFFSIYFVIIILLTFVIASLLVYILGKKIAKSTIFRYSVYSATVMVAVQLILMPFYRLLLIPLVLYWLLLFIVIYIHKPGDVRVVKTKPSIFTHKKDMDEDVDVDDRGNLKSSKRKRSFEEENEGYVELK